MSSPVPKRKGFMFQINRPILTGYMQKQGAIHKAFKRRFFVLYPGFLVYYEREDKWQFDVQRGDTLGSRLNAIKLKGGRLDKPKHAPKGCHYGIELISPDPHNKRREFLLNCQSNEERYQWMQKVHSAIPTSPANSPAIARANHSAEPAKTKEEEEEVKPQQEKPSTPTAVVGEEEDKSASPSSSPVRQETVDEAAMLAIGGHQDVEDELTDVDHVLGPRTTDEDEDRQSCDSTDSSPRSSLSPEDITQYTVQDDVVISSAAVEANSDNSSPSDSPIIDHKAVQPINEEQDEVVKNCYEEDDKKEDEVQSKEVTVTPGSSPELVITVTRAGSSQPSTGSSDDDSEGEEAPPADTTSNEGDRRSDSPTSSVPSSPTTNRLSNGDTEEGRLASPSPDLDARRPTGIKSFTEKRGFLYKMGGRYKTWKLRYFVLQPGMFSYYKKDPKEKPLGEVKLKNLQILFPKPNERTHSSYQFTVHTESQWNRRNDYVIAAKSEKEMKEWIDAFKLATGLKRLSSEAAAYRNEATVAATTAVAASDH